MSLEYWYGCSPPRTPTLRTCNYFWSFPCTLGPVNADQPALVMDGSSAFYSWQKRLDPAAYRSVRLPRPVLLGSTAPERRICRPVGVLKAHVMGLPCKQAKPWHVHDS